jgi:hypothetical protein
MVLVVVTDVGSGTVVASVVVVSSLVVSLAAIGRA